MLPGMNQRTEAEELEKELISILVRLVVRYPDALDRIECALSAVLEAGDLIRQEAKSAKVIPIHVAGSSHR
jgi:hypothetical protein